MFGLGFNPEDLPIRIVAFNGPAGSGKDSACLMLAEHANALHIKMSAPMKDIVEAATGYSREEIRTQQDKLFYNGKSLREHQIILFNNWMAQFGDDVLAQILVRTLRRNMINAVVDSGGMLPLFVLSDCGRQPELNALVDLVGKDNVLLFRLHREGFTFEGDIREYVYSDAIPSVDIYNDALSKFHDEVFKHVNAWNTQWTDAHRELITSLGGEVRKIK